MKELQEKLPEYCSEEKRMLNTINPSVTAKPSKASRSLCPIKILLFNGCFCHLKQKCLVKKNYFNYFSPFFFFFFFEFFELLIFPVSRKKDKNFFFEKLLFLVLSLLLLVKPESDLFSFKNIIFSQFCVSLHFSFFWKATSVIFYLNSHAFFKNAF